MKNLLVLFALVGGFLFLAPSSISAQTIHNATDCDFKVTVLYGLDLACRGSGSVTVTVPANGTINLIIPHNTSIIKATGGYTVPVASANCNFTVGKSSCNYSPDANIRCTGGCGHYRVSFTGGNINISN